MRIFGGGKAVQDGGAAAGASTLGGVRIAPITLSLPKTVPSICPECARPIPAEEYVDAGRVMMRKSCPEHGPFTDLVFSDAAMFLALETWQTGDGRGFENATPCVGTCPDRCGICDAHTTHTSLANIDLTSRCNLACDVCFADADRRGYELTFEQAAAALRKLREQRPAPAFAVQFSGGEPTIHPRFLDIVAEAARQGFSHIQAATNGIKLADPGFAIRAREAGLQYLYLQMDGVTDDVFLALRGRALLETKLRAIESARRAGLRVIFVPTIVKGVNDGQIGDLFRLAFENLDVVSGISFQPMTFTGRYPEAERLAKRFTLSDLAHAFDAQSEGVTTPGDWFPLSAAAPLVRYAGSLAGTTFINHACHPHCGIMSLLFVDEKRNAVPLTRFLDLKGLLSDVDRLAQAGSSGFGFKALSKMKALHALNHHFRAGQAPEGLGFTRFLQTLDGFADKKYSWNDEYKGHTYKTFYVLGMHFMDGYNYDLERVSRCGVHYSAPDGRLYPFCSYNSGPTHRTRVEDALSRD
jgi:uncharacterized radical SAM superfamily Fe-S cluster-containing enzyme